MQSNVAPGSSLRGGHCFRALLLKLQSITSLGNEAVVSQGGSLLSSLQSSTATYRGRFVPRIKPFYLGSVCQAFQRDLDMLMQLVNSSSTGEIPFIRRSYRPRLVIDRTSI
jgi:hypothetical protein